ncbi:MAG TPA: Rid family detoxifying hydrolase [Usitatibacter sp.]|nr:Rid family detoxifying hydrolase [Usitatibacter sp.]
MEAIITDTAPPARGHYSQALVHGDVVYVSGQLPIVPRDPERRLAGFEAQARQVIANVIAVLEAAGSSRDRILRTTVYIADIAHWPAFDALYAEVLGEHRPARTVVPVPALHNGYLVEMDAIAALRGS